MLAGAAELGAALQISDAALNKKLVVAPRVTTGHGLIREHADQVVKVARAEAQAHDLQ